MDCNQLLDRLRAMSSEKYKKNVIRMGIPEHSSIGVSTGDIRKLAREAGKSNELAHELWKTGFHEARLLAVLVFDKKQVSLSDIEKLMDDVVSWDLCDHLCKNLIIKVKGYDSLIARWIVSDAVYKKRAAFTLIASAVIHEKAISQETLDDFIRLITENSRDEREHVKKAASWALREIGKKDFAYNEKALLLAHEWKNSDNKAEKWISRDALKELENLVQVEGRKRLISVDSAMGAKCAE